ncbi:MAG: hypothetical protein HY876_00765 [Coriobacteriales bacterium]|nr:hypothetical protein [Coriobacteriales bacterium]
MALRFGLVVSALALMVVGLTAVPAHAYDLQDPTRDCNDCHSSDETGQQSRKGPHAGYTTGTQFCASCHEVHSAPAGSGLLLPGPTAKATCETCHDGTGGSGVFGALAARGVIPEGAVPPATHRMEVTNLVPGGSSEGTSTMWFSAEGLLSCLDCHSPHDAGTVEPFVGDRVRGEEDTRSPVSSSRLLRRMPTGADVAVSDYGSQWCASCHRARMTGGSGPAANHPVEDESLWLPGEYFHYGNVARVTGLDTTDTAHGALGGSNFGYVMPDTNGSAEAPARTEEQGPHMPICQQCHEDARNVGDFDDSADQGKVLSSDAAGLHEGFRPSVNGSETAAHAADPQEYYNPRFGSFPHESANEYFLIETDDDLCLNCHVKQ